jgi:hypothetical protein
MLYKVKANLAPNTDRVCNKQKAKLRYNKYSSLAYVSVSGRDYPGKVIMW